MAFQPESPSYDAGVYQLETVDPVDGGVGAVSNKPLLNLANRTAYLKQHVDNLENGTTIPPTVAPLNSPAFTGTPTVPTAPVGDKSLEIANTTFVNTLLSGVISVSVAGGSNVSLTQAQYGNGIIILTGALTANISVIFPVNGVWLVINNTSGAFTVTCKTSAGTGTLVTQGKSSLIYGDNTNIKLQQTDFISPALSGTPTAPTAALGDNSTTVANTAFVFNSRNGAVSVNVAGGSNVTLTQSQYGAAIVILTGALTGNINVIVPNNGQWIFENNTTGAYSITVKTSAGTGQLVPQGQSELLYSDGTNVQIAGAAATASFIPTKFTATAGQTTFPVSYTPGNVIVSRNGSMLTPGTDFTATDGANVVLTTGATAGDIVEVYAFSSFIVANALDKTKNLSDVANPATALSNIGGFPSAGGTITGNITANGTLTLASGTANGVAYLDASKNLVTGTALTFDGANLFATGNVTFGTNNTNTAIFKSNVRFGGTTAPTNPVSITGNMDVSGTINLVKVSNGGQNGSVILDGSATGIQAVAVGNSSTAGTYGTAVGQGASSASFGVALGLQAQSTSGNGVAIGRAASASSSQVVFGTNGVSLKLDQIYFGSGVTDTAPYSPTIQATGGSGTDIGGANLILAGGKNTGAGNPGNIAFQTATVGSSGTTLSALSTRMQLYGSGGLYLGSSGFADPGANNLYVLGSGTFNGDLTANGNVTLGNASTDTVQVNGYMGIGAAPVSGIGLYAAPTGLTSSSQVGFYSQLTGNSAATSLIVGFQSLPQTAAATFTVSNLVGFRAADATKGAGSTITNQHGVYILDQTQGANNYGITSLVSSGTNKWNIYASGSAANYFAGQVGFGTNAPTEQVYVVGNLGINGSGYLALDRNTTPAGAGTGAPLVQWRMVSTGSTYVAGASIQGISDGAWSATSTPMYLSFSTVPSGSTTRVERLRIDSAGNAGLGVTPNSTWTDVALQIGYSGSIHANKTQNYNGIGVNAVQVNSVSNYLQTGYALDHILNGVNGSFAWKVAPSGTAGGAITWTTAMTLFNSGGLSLGNTTDPGAGNLSVTGSVTAASFSGAGTGLTGTANSLNAGVGANQTWTDVTASRVAGTTYTNSTGKAIEIHIQALESTSGSVNISVVINGTITQQAPTTVSSGGATYSSIKAIIPNGQTYQVTASPSINKWFELR